MVFGELCGMCSGERNLNKHSLLRFLSILRSFYQECCEVFQGLQRKTGPCRTFCPYIYIYIRFFNIVTSRFDIKE